MIIYNVTIKAMHEIAVEWLQWMKNEHIPEVMGTGQFTGYKLCRLLDHDDEEGVTYIAQYFCNSMEEYDQYIERYAPDMRQRGFDRFGNKFIAFRTLMQVEQQG